MPMMGTPAVNLAAVSLIRAAIADDPDSGVLVMSQHGGCQSGTEGERASEFMMSLAAVAARSFLSVHGYNIARALETLDAWSADYAEQEMSGDGAHS